MIKYQLNITEVEPFTEEELKSRESKQSTFPYNPTYDRYSDKLYHERRMLAVEVTKEEFEIIEKYHKIIEETKNE